MPKIILLIQTAPRKAREVKESLLAIGIEAHTTAGPYSVIAEASGDPDTIVKQVWDISGITMVHPQVEPEDQ